MKRPILPFIIFGVLLFVGIAIMIKPATFVATSVPNEIPFSEQPNSSSTIPRGIIILGSAMTILGLVGLTIQAFRMFKLFDHEEASSD